MPLAPSATEAMALSIPPERCKNAQKPDPVCQKDPQGDISPLLGIHGQSGIGGSDVHQVLAVANI
jgi:hypothetical protein